tara:strand:- start:4 stop:117 length:114 start_codon:yes stop_codon:yes gene_type:complete
MPLLVRFFVNLKEEIDNRKSDKALGWRSEPYLFLNVF